MTTDPVVEAARLVAKMRRDIDQTIELVDKLTRLFESSQEQSLKLLTGVRKLIERVDALERGRGS